MLLHQQPYCYIEHSSSLPLQHHPLLETKQNNILQYKYPRLVKIAQKQQTLLVRTGLMIADMWSHWRPNEETKLKVVAATKHWTMQESSASFRKATRSVSYVDGASNEALVRKLRLLWLVGLREHHVCAYAPTASPTRDAMIATVSYDAPVVRVIRCMVLILIRSASET